MHSPVAEAARESEQPRHMPWPDRLAIGASVACLVHCLLLPLLLAAVPAASRALALPEELHLLAFAAAVPISAVAMRQGYRHHGLILPSGLGLVGLALLGIGALAGFDGFTETGVTLAGSVTLAFAHLRNWQLRQPRLGSSHAAERDDAYLTSLSADSAKQIDGESNV